MGAQENLLGTAGRLGGCGVMNSADLQQRFPKAVLEAVAQEFLSLTFGCRVSSLSNAALRVWLWFHSSTLWVIWDSLFTLSHHLAPGPAWPGSCPSPNLSSPTKESRLQSACLPKGDMRKHKSSVTLKPPIFSILPGVFSFGLNSLLTHLCIHKSFGINLFVWKLSSMGQMAFKCILI